MAHLSVKHFSPLRKSFSPSRRHWRHLGSRLRAIIMVPQIRRRFGGRQPLCGTGVTSAILEIFNPRAFNARTADSRPGRGRLARPLDPVGPGGRPGERIALPVGYGHDGIVEGGVNVRDAFRNILLYLLAYPGCSVGCGWFCHVLVPQLAAQLSIGAASVGAPQPLLGAAWSLIAAVRR